RRWVEVAVVFTVIAALVAEVKELSAQAPPPDQPPPPLVIGRDYREQGEVIGKGFLLKVWLSEVGGAGVQQIHAVRVGPDGNIAVPGLPPIHAEGLTIGALEVQLMAPIKPALPKASAWISILERTPPPAPPAPPAPAPP